MATSRRGRGSSVGLIAATPRPGTRTARGRDRGDAGDADRPRARLRRRRGRGTSAGATPGTSGKRRPPPGFFCPDPTVTPKRCSAGHYCRLGSFKPSPCPFYATCGESGLDAPDVQTTAAVMLLSVFAMFFVVIRGSKAARGCLRRYRDQQKERLAARLEDLLEARAAGRAADVLGTTPPVVARGASDGFSPELPRRENTRSGSGPARWELPSLPRKSAAERVDLAFDALGCTVRADGKQLRVLSGVTGAIRGGRVAAIMGPSGAGKTSLLNVLAGRTSRGAALDGRLLVNGEKHAAAAARLRPATGYVPQEDVLCAALTVRECLEFSAATRLPPSTPCSKRRAVVDDVMQVLGLAAHRNRVVGDVLKRGLSGGQRKRVNVGTELVADPTLLFADEPTSGLDSATSLDVIGAFHACAARGATVAVVLHQPSIQIYRLFDDVLLLVPGGRTAYRSGAEVSLGERLCRRGVSASPSPRRRDPPPRFVHASRPRRRRDPHARSVHVGAAAPPRPASAECPRRGRAAAATASPRNVRVAAAASPRPPHGLSTSRPRRRRDPASAEDGPTRDPAGTSARPNAPSRGSRIWASPCPRRCRRRTTTCSF